MRTLRCSRIFLEALSARHDGRGATGDLRLATDDIVSSTVPTYAFSSVPDERGSKKVLLMSNRTSFQNQERGPMDDFMFR